VVAGIVLVVLVQVFVFDARHRLILNKVMYPAIALGLLASPINPLILGTSNALGNVDSAVLGAVVGGGLFLALVVLSGGGVGLGDAKLTFFLGAILGFLPLYNPPIVRALIFGVVCGGVIAGLLLLTRVRGMRDFIPYGPFLCVGGAVVILFPVQ
jgi:leader peptidase (prepilin peptidase)/N-methyltransferase